MKIEYFRVPFKMSFYLEEPRESLLTVFDHGFELEKMEVLWYR